MVVAGAALAVGRPPWTASTEDRIVVACWAAAMALWAWLVAVGAVHAWATRTGRRRWRRLSGMLLPGAVRRRVEQVALAGMLVVPVAACGTGAEEPAAPVLVLEETLTLDRPGTETSTTTVVTTAPSTTIAPPTTDTGTDTAPDGEPDPSGDVPAAPAPASPGPEPPSSPSGSTIPERPPAPSTTLPAAPGGVPAPSAAPVSPPPVAVDPRLDAADPVDDPAYTVPAEAGTRVVLRGDNLWSIAARHLADATGRTPTGDEVRTYWAAVVAENRPTLASGNPDVIYAGEVIRLPSIP